MNVFVLLHGEDVLRIDLGVKRVDRITISHHFGCCHTKKNEFFLLKFIVRSLHIFYGHEYQLYLTKKESFWFCAELKIIRKKTLQEINFLYSRLFNFLNSCNLVFFLAETPIFFFIKPNTTNSSNNFRLHFIWMIM